MSAVPIDPREQFMRAYAAMAVQAPVPNYAGYTLAKQAYERMFVVAPDVFTEDMQRLARMHGV